MSELPLVMIEINAFDDKALSHDLKISKTITTIIFTSFIFTYLPDFTEPEMHNNSTGILLDDLVN